MSYLYSQTRRPRRRWAKLSGGSVAYVVATTILATAPLQAFAQVGAGAVATAPGVGNGSDIDYGNARPMPLPQSGLAPPTLLEALLSNQAAKAVTGPATVSPGKMGDGQLSAVQLTTARSSAGSDGVESKAFGTLNHVFTTSRVNVKNNQTSKFYPYSAAGKLFFNIGADTYVCSASLIKRGIVVTAAHCVAEFKSKQYYTNWRFVPAYNNGSAPFGVWKVSSARVLTSYFNGSDSCAVSGVVCANDVGVLTLKPQGGPFPGPHTGYLGYGINSYSYNSLGQVLISQLGYPVALDGGALMERTDSQGIRTPGLSKNTVIGSLQTGGSSGGPWV